MDGNDTGKTWSYDTGAQDQFVVEMNKDGSVIIWQDESDSFYGSKLPVEADVSLGTFLLRL